MSVPTTTVVAFMLLLARASALTMTVPIIGVMSVPGPVRAFFAAALALAATAGLADPSVVPAGGAALLTAVLVEVIIGLGAGLVARFVFEGLTAAGSIAGLAMGLGYASVVDPLTGAESTALARWLTTVGLLFAVQMGVHQDAVAWFLWSSVAIAPRTEVLPYVLDGVLSGAASAIVFGIRLGFPILATVTLGNLALGVVGRFSPQLNMQSLGLSMGIMSGGAVVYLVTPSIGSAAATAMREVIAAYLA